MSSKCIHFSRLEKIAKKWLTFVLSYQRIERLDLHYLPCFWIIPHSLYFSFEGNIPIGSIQIVYGIKKNKLAWQGVRCDKKIPLYSIGRSNQEVNLSL